jgi:Ca-activated chloride channel family protein
MKFMIHPQVTSFLLRFALLAFVFSALFLFTAQSVAAQDEEVIRIPGNLVQLNVGVVDPKGRPVTNLSRNDFAIYEDGVKQSIQSFEATDRPFSVVLMLDVSGSTIAFRESFKQAAYRFLDALSPEDRVEVVAFNEKIKTIAPFTTNRRKVADAIFAADGKGQTEFYKALSFAISELDKEGNRRKAIVVMTDGIDSNLRKADRAATENAKTDAEAIAALRPDSSPELLSVLSAADKRGVTVYPLALPSGDPAHIPLPDPQILAIYTAARVRMQLLADRTGGQLTAIKGLDSLARVYNQVAADLRTLYTIAYQPSGKESKPGWRAIRIEVTQPDLIARTKPGYVAR